VSKGWVSCTKEWPRLLQGTGPSHLVSIVVFFIGQDGVNKIFVYLAFSRDRPFGYGHDSGNRADRRSIRTYFDA